MEATVKTAPQTKRPRRRLRRLLWLGVLVGGASGLLLLAAPTIASMDFVRVRVERRLADALGAKVRIGSYSLGWFSGFSLASLEIENPPGFPSDRKLLVVKQARGKLGISSLLRGKIDVRAEIEGLELRAHEDRNGVLNLAKLFGVRAEASGTPQTAPPDAKGEVGSTSSPDLANMRLNLQLHDALIEISDAEHGPLQSLRHLDAKLVKDYGSADLLCTLEAELHSADQTETPGKLVLEADLDATLERPLTLTVELHDLRLSGYRPLLAGFFEPGSLTAFEGELNGTIDARINARRRTCKTSGELELLQPHFAGPLLHDMNLQAPRWLLHPNLQLDMSDQGAPPQIDTSGLSADLGFLRMKALTPAEASPLAGGRAALGVRIDANLADLVKLGGPMPDALGQRGGKLEVLLAIAPDPDLFEPHLLQSRLLDLLHVQASLTTPQLGVHGFEFSNLTCKLGVAQGKVTAEAHAGMQGGTLAASADTDLHQRNDLPGELHVSLSHGKLQGPASRLLRYAVPLLAGADAGAELAGIMDADFALHGPLLRRDKETNLQWLNRWRGKGSFGLQEGAFTPSPALARLVSLAGSSGRLAFKTIAGAFELEDGFVASSLTQIDRASRRIGLTGRTSLAGGIEFDLDLTDLLAHHRDGAKILALLGGKAPAARLLGTLEAPRLAMPNLTKMLQQAAASQLGDAARKAFEGKAKKGLESAIRKGLGGLFGHKKKKK